MNLTGAQMSKIIETVSYIQGFMHFTCQDKVAIWKDVINPGWIEDKFQCFCRLDNFLLRWSIQSIAEMLTTFGSQWIHNLHFDRISTDEIPLWSLNYCLN